MYKMLVVDDDRSEREGVKFLIEQFDWKLDISEADSGESALDYIQNREVDILLTDIRMKALDGLQLAEKVREASPNTKIIFMSAYGEFEYAQKAIDLGAIQYILKPVEIREFMRVVSGVIQLCEEERKEREVRLRMQDVHWKGIRYEKQKFLYDILHGKGVLEEGEINDSVEHFGSYRYLRMVMLHTRKRFFDISDLDFERILEELTHWKADVVNLNEIESVVFYEVDSLDTEADLMTTGRKLVDWFKENNCKDVCVIFSGLIESLRQIPKQYNEIEVILANKFFLDQGAVLFTDESSAGDQDISDYTGKMIKEITLHLKEGEHDCEQVYPLIDAFQSSGNLSENYVKYIYSEILKSLVGYPNLNNINEFMFNLERIYLSTTLNELQHVMKSIMKQFATSGAKPSESLRKVIDDVVRIIELEYDKDISLESIAERVYLSPGYLSRLFKKYKKKSIIKYITSLRLEKAGQLLVHTNKKITDICQEVGYSNFAYFSSLIKNHFGKTPSQYREDHRI